MSTHPERIGLVLAGAMTTAAAGGDPPTWKPPEFVANVPAYFLNFDLYEGQDRFLAYDHFGNAGIAYIDQVNQGSTFWRAYYARFVPGLGWVSSSNLSIGVEPTEASQPCLAFNFSEQPTLTCMSNPILPEVDTELFFDTAVEGAANWTSEEVNGFGAGLAAMGRERLASSLTYDVLGRAHVIGSFLDILSSADTVEYIYDSDGDGELNDETDMQVLDLDPFGYEDISMTLAVDSLARPMCAVWLHDLESPEPNQIIFAAKDIGQTWQSTTLASDARHPSIAIDPDTDYPAVAYHDVLDDDLMYAWWNGSQWVHDVVDAAGITGLWPSLAFDPADGNPSIAYHSQTTGSLMYAWHDGATWNTQPAAAGTFEVPTGFTPSLAFNDFGSGFPSIAYFDIQSNLMFVEDPPAPGDLDGDGTVGIADLLWLLGDWGLSQSPADLNQDGTVDVVDLLTLLGNWG